MKILFVLPRCPWPPYVGQARLAFYRARELSKLGHSVHLFCYGTGTNNLLPDQLAQLSEVFDSCSFHNLYSLHYFLLLVLAIPRFFLSEKPLIASSFTPLHITCLFKRLVSVGKFDLVHFYSIRSFPLWGVAERLGLHFVVDLVDSMALNFQNRLEKLSFLVRPLFSVELRRVKRFELSLPAYVNCKAYLVVGSKDLSCLSLRSSADSRKPCQSDQLPCLKICPIGVESFAHDNIDYSVCTSPRIIFFGSLSYTPNVEALEWMIHRVYRLLVNHIPNVKFLVVGSNPSHLVRSLCSEYPSIQLVENPPSIAHYLLSSFASVAPMVSGSGQQFKVIESLVNSVPCVTTSLAADPLGLLDGINVSVANTPSEFASKISQLFYDTDLAKRVSRSGRDYVLSQFSWSASAEILEAIYCA